ncbi:MAG TPA: MFS transporter, partial [Oceanithermus profundus]|nr:MFS transporter [Oceanithermus profundus]
MRTTTRYTLASLILLFWLGFFVATPGAVLPLWRTQFGVLGEMALFFNLQLAGLLVGVGLATR